MSLDVYRAKRNFSATPEPRGKTRRAPRQNAFVVQKHDARRLHYDFRLELDGVLKSWAVAKGPSLVPGEKRLAVEVEDHPLDYGDFEGTIPKGEYGGGTVIVWDKGTWRPLGEPNKGLAKGHLEFELYGQKLSGRWHLARMARKPRDKYDNWLLIKGDDDDARRDGDPDILEQRPESVKTGRVIAEVASEEPGWSSTRGKLPKRKPPRAAPAKIAGARKAALPAFVEPALASLAKAPPKGASWVHEIKFDGYRLQARIESGAVTLLTRSGLDWTEKFGARLKAALGALPARKALLDGELVVENASGAADFSLLQADLSEGRTDRFRFYLFDALYLDGYDLRDAPLVERKQLLAGLLAGAQGPLRLSEHFEEDGALVLRHVCRLALEGVVSKRADSPYCSGRSKSWIKSKCLARQEFVIGGYALSTVSPKTIGSLALGVHEGDELIYAGRVGTGFTEALADELFRRLRLLETSASPFSKPLGAEARGLHFVRPERVAEVEYRGWTADGRLRHASFRGLREDKGASSIVREDAASSVKAADNIAVRLTHPDRLYWPDAGVTKQGLADYYAEIWPRAAPFLVGRALALLRCPDGIGGQSFFQKHVWKGAGSAIVPVRDPADPDQDLVSIETVDGLIDLVQSAALEIHPWGSTARDWERPDILIMDLDPGETIAWDAVIAAAREIAERLRRAGLTAFVKTSGGKGLHVAAPLKPKAEWPQVKAFAKGVADGMASDSPGLYVATIPKARRHGKILIDYLRNQRGATAVAPYSSRARPGAAVSMPLAWDELDTGIGPAHFTVLNAPARLASLSCDPWEDFREAAAPIESILKTRKR
jgi:bifunctional non-homologous end joining protein LigD